ncbi:MULTISPECIES: L-lactate permease [Actinomyces]|uniref:L-lactate permease n=1 Tax=Actinomyces TaxID=1654 RepID=UPI001F20B709|nr:MULTISPECIES: L-lactate permease [Actinomyces]
MSPTPLSVLAPLSFTPSTTAVGGNVFISAIVGLLPLIVFFVLMGVFKVKTHWCSLIALVLSIFIAVAAFHMPVGMSLLSATQGATMGLMPIVYIIVAAVWLYNLTETSGRAEDLKSVFDLIGKGDQRAQALIVAWCFSGLLEGLAGFGAPVAITCAMLLSLGMPKIKAAVVAMVGNGINVGFGAMAIPVTTAGRLGGEDPVAVAAVMGHMTAIIAIAVPLVLLFVIDGMRGVKQLWPLALAGGAAMAAGHFFVSQFSYELTAVSAALFSLIVCTLFLAVWTPRTPEDARTSVNETDRPDAGRISLALLPYVLVVVIIATTKLVRPLSAFLSSTDVKIPWPGIYGNLLTPAGEPASSAIYTLQTLSNPGTWIFVTGLVVAVVYGRLSSGGRFQTSVSQMLMVLPRTIHNLRLSILTIALVMSLAYVMNFSGQTTAVGAALASTGAAFAFISPTLGWLGTAVAGSATSAGALFANLQATAAAGAHLDPQVLLAANTAGGGLGKLVSPQNLAVATSALDAPDQDAEILKKVAPYSIVFLLVLCTITLLASTGVLGFYMP